MYGLKANSPPTHNFTVQHISEHGSNTK